MNNSDISKIKSETDSALLEYENNIKNLKYIPSDKINDYKLSLTHFKNRVIGVIESFSQDDMTIDDLYEDMLNIKTIVGKLNQILIKDEENYKISYLERMNEITNKNKKQLWNKKKLNLQKQN